LDGATMNKMPATAELLEQYGFVLPARIPAGGKP
jgi:hypothetical protein